MGERKVAQKYYPPDFDPAVLAQAQRGKKRGQQGPEKNQYKIRFMMPMSVRCLTCGEYIYRGKKFNSRKETVQGETYLGIKIFRFYVRCPRCSGEFTIKTDPQNSDYLAEAGCTKNFEPWKDMAAAVEAAKAAREAEEKEDATKVLENRAKDSKREMDILEALEDIRHTNAKANQVTPDQLWEQHVKHFSKMTDEEAAELQRYYESREFVRRLSEDDEDEDGESVDDQVDEDDGVTDSKSHASSKVSVASAPTDVPKAPTTVLLALPTKQAPPTKTLSGVVIKAVAKAKPAPAAPAAAPPPPKPEPPAGLGLLNGYASD